MLCENWVPLAGGDGWGLDQRTDMIWHTFNKITPAAICRLETVGVERERKKSLDHTLQLVARSRHWSV